MATYIGIGKASEGQKPKAFWDHPAKRSRLGRLLPCAGQRWAGGWRFWLGCGVDGVIFVVRALIQDVYALICVVFESIGGVYEGIFAGHEVIFAMAWSLLGLGQFPVFCVEQRVLTKNNWRGDESV